MCPWLSGKKCLSCSTARVKALLLFLADCAQWERQFGNKSVPGFSTRMSSWRKRFQSEWKIPPSTKCFISLLGTCNEAKGSAQAGGEGERLSFALCPRSPRASSGQSEGDLLSQTHCLPDWKQGFSTSSLFYSRLYPQLWGSVFSDLSFPFSPDEALKLAKTN